MSIADIVIPATEPESSLKRWIPAFAGMTLMVAAFLIAILITAIQWVGAFEAYLLSSRGVVNAKFLFDQFLSPVTHLITFIVPDFWGKSRILQLFFIACVYTGASHLYRHFCFYLCNIYVLHTNIAGYQFLENIYRGNVVFGIRVTYKLDLVCVSCTDIVRSTTRTDFCTVYIRAVYPCRIWNRCDEPGGIAQNFFSNNLEYRGDDRFPLDVCDMCLVYCTHKKLPF